MIRAWLNLSTFGTFSSLAVLYSGLAVALVVLVFASPLRGRIATLTGVVAPFFSSVAVLFSLLTGFLAYDVGERNRQATRAVQTEAGELQNVYTLSVASVTDMTAIRVALKAYVRSIVSDEWPAVAGASSVQTDPAFDQLLSEISNPAISRDASAPVHSAMLTAAVRAGTARSTRLSLATDRTNELKWISVLILGAITQLALALVHLEKPRAMMAALTVFSTGAVVALGLIALQEDPFSGVFRVSTAPLQHLLTLSDTAPPLPSAAPAK
jgi:hypothetical protein